MTWQKMSQAQAWNPPPAPRIVNRGIQGGTFTLDQADGQWKSVLKLQSKCPDAPSAASNDHYRTIYVQQTTCGALERQIEDATVQLGVILRVSFGIGNGQMKTFYDVCSNGILHAAITGESVEVDACTTKIFWDSDEDLPDCDEDPIPIRADGEPPTIVIGVIQNQALAMNRIATPKRSFNIVAPNSVPVPPGAQSVLVMGDPSGLTAAQVFTSDGSTTIPFPINTEVDIAPGVWRIDVASADGDQSTVMFGLGI